MGDTVRQQSLGAKHKQVDKRSLIISQRSSKIKGRRESWGVGVSTENLFGEYQGFKFTSNRVTLALVNPTMRKSGLLVWKMKLAGKDLKQSPAIFGNKKLQLVRAITF